MSSPYRCQRCGRLPGDHADMVDATLCRDCAEPWPIVAIDTETTGCDPRTQSPVGRARLWCLTAAWYFRGEVRTAFWRRKEVLGSPTLRAWLENPAAPKVGSRLLTYDSHVLANEGITLRGVIGDTERMSRLLDPRRKPDHTEGHGLKALGAALGHDVREYTEIASRPKKGATGAYRRSQTCVVDGVTVHRVEGAPWQRVSLSRREQIPLDELWELYPQRRKALQDYAVQDAVMSLRVYGWLRLRLKYIT